MSNDLGQTMINTRLKVENLETVLVVDDEITIRMLIAAVLGEAGFVVLEAADGAEALEMVAEHRIDCVVTDAMMPNVNGFDLCNMIRFMPGGERIQVLFMTGLDDIDSIRKAYASGANDFIAKSTNPHLLVERVRFLVRSQQMQDDLRQSEQRLKYAQRLASLGHWERTLDGRTRAVSSVVCQFMDVSDPKVLTWDYLLEHSHADDRTGMRTTLEHAISSRNYFQLEHRFIGRGGRLRILRHQGEFNQDATGEWLIYSTVQDVTENRAQEDRIRFLAFHDPLTELPNRESALRNLTRLLKKQGERRSITAVFALNLDDLSRITGSLGQQVGNQILKAVGERLRRQVRESDNIMMQGGTESGDGLMIARGDGDKFICIVSNLQIGEAALSIAARLQRAIAAPLKIQNHEFQLSASVGISLYPDDALDADQLLDNAFIALLHARGQKGACQLFAAEITDQARQRLSLEAQLRQAVERQEFELFYQPRLNLRDNRIHGAEALLRWRHPERGLVSPGEFVPALEEAGLIAVAGNQVIDMAVKQATQWAKSLSPDLRISFNISPLQFGATDLVAEVDRAVQRHHGHFINLEAEITESTLVANPDQVIKALHEFRARGMRMALDDFGTGFSSLGMLRDLPFDILKIDRSFVADIGVNRNGSALINAILLMAGALGLECVAEGVELDSQLHYLSENGCHEVQGFLLARPMPAADCERWIRQWHDAQPASDIRLA